MWPPSGGADPALEAGATAQGMGSPAGGEIPNDNHKGECANYLLFKPLSVPGVYTDSAHALAKPAYCLRDTYQRANPYCNIFCSTAPMSASSGASETGSTVDNEIADDDDGDIQPTKQRGQGLPLPEVVHRLLKEPHIIRWDPAQR